MFYSSEHSLFQSVRFYSNNENELSVIYCLKNEEIKYIATTRKYSMLKSVVINGWKKSISSDTNQMELVCTGDSTRPLSL
jgi:hypothetical protein